MAKISRWNPERGFGFVETPQGEAFLHFSVISPRPARGTDLKGAEINILGIEAGEKGPRVTEARRVGSNPTSAQPAPAQHEEQNAPVVLTGWRLGEKPGEVVADRRRGRAFTVLTFSIGEARSKGCPDWVLKKAQGWVEAVASANAPFYTRYGEGEGVGVVVPEVVVLGDALRDQALARLKPSSESFSMETVDGTEGWRGFGYYLGLSLTGGNYDLLVSECQRRGWHPVAIGYWGRKSGPPSWRFVDDPQVTSVLGIAAQSHPDLRPATKEGVLDRSPREVRDLAPRAEVYQGQSPRLPNLEVETHVTVLARTAGRESGGMFYTSFDYGASLSSGRDWLRPSTKVSINTALSRTAVKRFGEEWVLEIPVGWGIVKILGRDLTVEVMAKDEAVVTQTAGNVFVMLAPFGQGATVKLSSFHKAGKWSRVHEWGGRLTVVEDGAVAEEASAVLPAEESRDL